MEDNIQKNSTEIIKLNKWINILITNCQTEVERNLNKERKPNAHGILIVNKLASHISE